jgi:hypothetical protein
VRQKGKEPVVPDLFHVDEPQLTVVKRNAIAPPKKAAKPGGPSFSAPRK